MAMEQAVPSFAVWLGTRVIPTCLAIACTISMTGRSLAFDCLAYKPERAQGQWHADVVSGKICWYGPNWRSFLPKPKARVENSQVTNTEPVTQFVDRSPSQVEKRKDSVQAANDRTDAQVENGKPEISDNSKPLATETVDREKTEEFLASVKRPRRKRLLLRTPFHSNSHLPRSKIPTQQKRAMKRIPAICL